MLRLVTVRVPLANADFFIRKNHNIFVAGLLTINARKQIRIKRERNQEWEFPRNRTNTDTDMHL